MPASEPYVQKYLWKDTVKPFHEAWQVTLTATEAVAFLGFFTCLLAYTETRVWVILRLLVIRFSRPIRLLDRNDPGSLHNLTQGEALAMAPLYLLGLSSTRRHRGSLRTTGKSDIISVPLLLTLAAVTNLTLFPILGVLIPWFLTGGLQNPVVQSKVWDGCTLLGPDRDKTAYMASDLYRNCWHNMTEIPDTCNNRAGILLDRPVLQIVRNSTCPFAQSACRAGTAAIQFEHVNTTLREYGINLNSSILHSHRLTCAPLEVERFVRNDTEGAPWLDFGQLEDDRELIGMTEQDDSGQVPVLRHRLSSPHNYAPHVELPATSTWRDDTPPDVKYWGPNSRTQHQNGKHAVVHQDLARDDGEVILVVFNAGRSKYIEPIDDPIYSAHLHGSDPYYYSPDYEYTAIGCLEQHRLCIFGTRICSNYSDMIGAMAQIGYEAWHGPREDSDLDKQTVAELHSLEEIYYEAAVDIFIASRGSSALLSSEASRWTDHVQINPLRQWELDVQFWFESAFLSFRLVVHSMVTTMGLDSFWHTDQAQRVICGHALFIDSDYTNINFVGLITALVAVSLVSVASHADMPLKRGRQVVKILNAVGSLGSDLAAKTFKRAGTVANNSFAA